MSEPPETQPRRTSDAPTLSQPEHDLIAAARREVFGPSAAAHGQTTAGSSTDATQLAVEFTPPESATLAADSFPGYQVLRLLSHGGQGVVYEAIQVATKQKVAIKVPLEGLHAPPAARRRFEREIELAAQLKHPCIVSVLHAGQTPEGRQFYAMEYIPGVPLTDYVRARQLGLDDALRLLAEVCEAVQFAHQRGVIHRDLKPSNIFVAEVLEPSAATSDSETRPAPALGRPKVLDFGLAKWLVAPADARWSQTQGVVGTPAYMSPEQARGSTDAIDTRTDIYSLGVILYEVLTGTLPFPFSGSWPDVLRQIAEVQPTPPGQAWTAGRGIGASSGRRSATRFGRAARRPSLGRPATPASRPGVCPIDDEMTTIVLKCLAKEPARRYQSAAELARDLRHYLAGEAIDAKRDSALYVLRKTLRRHRIAVAVATALSVFVTGALAVTLALWRDAAQERDRANAAEADAEHQLQEARIARDRAEKEARKSTAVVDFLKVALQSPDPDRAGRDVRMADVLDRAAEKAATDLESQPDVQAALLGTLGLTYLKLGLDQPAQQSLETALALAREVLGPEHQDTLAIAHNLASVYMYQRKLPELEALLPELWDAQRRTLGAAHESTLITLNLLAELRVRQTRLDEAEALRRELVTQCAQALGAEHRLTLVSRGNLAWVLWARREFDEAEAMFRALLPVQRRVLGEADRFTLMTLSNLATLLLERERYADAEPLSRAGVAAFRELLGEQHADTLAALQTLARILRGLGRLEEAGELFRQILTTRRAVLPPGHWHLADSLHELGAQLVDEQQYAEAETLLNEALTIRTALMVPTDVRRLETLTVLGAALQGQGRYAEAETMLLDVHAALAEFPGVKPRRVSGAIERLVQLYDAWHAAEPAGGYDAQAAAWRATLAEWLTSAAPASQPTTQP